MFAVHPAIKQITIIFVYKSADYIDNYEVNYINLVMFILRLHVAASHLKLEWITIGQRFIVSSKKQRLK